MNFEQARFNMIEQQVRTWDVLDANVLNLMDKLQREDFVPKKYQGVAYADVQVPLAHEQVMLPPREIGRILQALQVQPEEHVLEIGTGTGYLTALLAMQAAHVVSVEMFADLSAAADSNCQKHAYSNITFQVGNAAHGWEDNTSFSIICITGAIPRLTESWKRQLKIGGRLFAIVGTAPVMQAILVTRVHAEEWEQQILYETLLPMLVDAQPLPQFEF
ncbi:MAG: protein-L-isoaspartate O-methyltransferase [Gammaproteobacteria bacterium]